jgi:hypothetical protein
MKIHEIIMAYAVEIIDPAIKCKTNDVQFILSITSLLITIEVKYYSTNF